jgi:16S rRNA C967 or C1407 C5-methylase (RsmB/RsmF family)
MVAKEPYESYTTFKVNTVMKEYYSKVLSLEESDFNAFWDILQEQLPVTFRISPLHNNYQTLISNFSSKAYFDTILGPSSAIKIDPIPWYPNNLVWQINSSRSELRKHENIKEFHSFIQKANDSGLITRQELVSMIPPIVLQPVPNEKILDMCAAPGSKTAQLIELMQGQGLVVANDVDTNRAYMLIHQLHRSNTSSMVVVNHQAQSFPRLNYSFDKVLCDVPCSGDGAIRKLPSKWRKWNVKDGQGVHALQISIFRRGVQLLKPSGLICYSTCSLNPIEDEAVVNQVCKEFDLEIIDLYELLAALCPGLIVRRAMRTWKVLGNSKDKESGFFVEYPNYESVPENITSIKKTMFPVDVVAGIENTIRILPHDQNTGGFYIALFRKKMNIPGAVYEEIKDNYPETPPHSEDVSEKPKKKRKILDVVQPLYITIKNNSDYENLTSVFGLENLPIDQLLTPLTKNCKNLFFVSPQVQDFLNADESRAIKVLNVGVCAFSKNKHGPTKALSVYRPHQDALPFISKFVTKNRLYCDDLELLKILLKTGSFESKEYLEVVNGYYVMTFNSIQEEVLVLKVSEDKFNTVVPREHIDSLFIRYPILK